MAMRFSLPLPAAPYGLHVHSPAFKFGGHEFRLKVFPHGNQVGAGSSPCRVQDIPCPQGLRVQSSTVAHT